MAWLPGRGRSETYRVVALEESIVGRSPLPLGVVLFGQQAPHRGLHGPLDKGLELAVCEHPAVPAGAFIGGDEVGEIDTKGVSEEPQTGVVWDVALAPPARHRIGTEPSLAG